MEEYRKVLVLPVNYPHLKEGGLLAKNVKNGVINEKSC
jgi:hypothetical protein